jgi:excisionase family DNA binding protein
MMSQTGKLVSLAVAAERPGVSVKTLRRRIADGSLPAYRIGPTGSKGAIRVDPEDVERLLRRIPTADGSHAA